MAHGRVGPDIVMNIRYAGTSEIRALDRHEVDREPDGVSAIDPERSHLNKVLHGPATQGAAINNMLASGVKPPAKQAERPYVQLVLSASPSFFRADGQGAGEWDSKQLDRWTRRSMAWLRREYGADLAHVSLHLDEDTPHLHVLVVPTYEKRARRPGRKKRNETEIEFQERLDAADARPTIRTMGRASSAYWSEAFARRDARKSYHAAVEKFGLGYGRDFVGEGEPSPESVPTGRWVREKAAENAARASGLDSDRSDLDAQKAEIERKTGEIAFETASLVELRSKIEVERRELDERTARIEAEAAEAQTAVQTAQIEADRLAARARADIEAAAEARAEAAAEMREARSLIARIRPLWDELVDVMKAWRPLAADADVQTQTARDIRAAYPKARSMREQIAKVFSAMARRADPAGYHARGQLGAMERDQDARTLAPLDETRRARVQDNRASAPEQALEKSARPDPFDL